MYQAIYSVLCMTYAAILRPLLIKAVDDPDEEWDDILLALCDGLFNYKEGD